MTVVPKGIREEESLLFFTEQEKPRWVQDQVNPVLQYRKALQEELPVQLLT